MCLDLQIHLLEISIRGYIIINSDFIFCSVEYKINIKLYKELCKILKEKATYKIVIPFKIA